MNPEEFVILDLEISVSDGHATTTKTINPALYEMTLYSSNDYTVVENDFGGIVGYLPNSDFTYGNDLTYSILSDQDLYASD